ncbi:MAG: DUF1648 domain-containing protein [Oscillospiraceae bacterium]|nr:DUF1648 domain-containing protein [Oscillospiraceae bacterium]
MNELNVFCFVTNIAVTVLIGAFMPIVPILTRKSFLFGVKIPLEEHGCEEAKILIKKYIATCLTGTIAILALNVAQFIAFPEMTLAATMYFPLLFVAVQMAAFVPNWKRAVKLKEQKGWKVSESVFAETKSSHSRGNLSDLPWIWYAAGAILIFAGAVIILARYPELPDPMPTHFDINMQPDAWSDKNLINVMALPLLNFAMLAIMWFANVMFVRAKLQIDAQNPEISFAQHRIYRRRMGNSMGFMTLGIVLAIILPGFLTVFPDLNFPFWIIMVLVFVPMVPLIAVSIASGQGGCRIKANMAALAQNPEKPDTGKSGFEGVSGRGDDKYWAIGMFYHNPDDPAIIVEDRFGNNLGFNYSRLPVKIGVALLLLALAAMYAAITIWLI